MLYRYYPLTANALVWDSIIHSMLKEELFTACKASHKHSLSPELTVLNAVSSSLGIPKVTSIHLLTVLWKEAF